MHSDVTEDGANLLEMVQPTHPSPSPRVGDAGEVVAAHADGALDRQQTIMVAYHRSRAAPAAGCTHGLMAAVGLAAEEAKVMLAVRGSILGRAFCCNWTTYCKGMPWLGRELPNRVCF